MIMKNGSIYGKKWLDIVFEGKNKEYGAYKLRQEESKTTAKAFFSSSFLLIGILSAVVFLTSFGDKPDEVIIVCKLPSVTPIIFDTKPDKNIEQKKHFQSETESKEVPKNVPMQVVETKAAQDDVPKNSEQSTTPVASNSGTPDGSLPPDGTPETGGTEPAKVPFTGIAKTSELDKQPTFPGGMNRFYDYIGRNFQKTDVENETNTIKVLMSFVIEPNGEMTDIKILQSTNSIVNEEAIRVLKSLKTKWVAGIKDGQSVHTQFKLPISVQVE